MKRIVAGTIVGLLLSSPASAVTLLFDFETDDQIKEWTVRSAGQDTLAASTQFATAGKRSAVFRTPKWKHGMQEWPAFEACPPAKDWSKAKTLVIDLVNPTNATATLKLFVTDPKTKLQQAASASFTIKPRSHLRARVPLSSFGKKVDRTSITRVHFFMTRPEEAVTIHLDQIALLADGEAPPALPTCLTQQLVRLMIGPDLIRQTRAKLDTVQARLEKQLAKNTPARGWFARQLKTVRAEFERLAAAYEAGTITLDQAARIRDGLARKRTSRLESLAELVGKSVARGGSGDVVIGQATSMDKILPRDMPVDIEIAKTAALELARNETESLQLVVIPLATDLRGVRVEVDDLATSSGQRLPAHSVDVRVVGYVKTGTPPYAVSYEGWWPDPLLDFLPAVDIAPGDAQAFWVRVRAPKDATPATYTGKLSIKSGDRSLGEIALSVTVHGFTMPDRSPLPTAMSVYPQFPKKLAGADWPKREIEWVDYLADYYIDYDSLYRKGAPNFDILKRLDDQGRLVAFNLRYFASGVFRPDLSDVAFDKHIKALIADVGEIYGRAKKLGLGDRAYFYGFDERGREYFPMLQRICAAITKAFPDLLLMTTSYDHSYGLTSGVTAMKAWCPLTPRYFPDKVAQARQKGTKVWWYICCGPRHPYANWFVEYPAIEARLLMGMMTAKYRPEGFLYYAITRWPNNTKPITTGPFTTWNPASYKTYNGDGSLLCPAEGGRPLATIRLENFRDGLEDYAYVRILEETIKAKASVGDKLTDRDKAWLERAKGVLTVPESLVKNMANYSRDAKALYAYRHRIAQAIDAAGIPPVDPWKK